MTREYPPTVNHARSLDPAWLVRFVLTGGTVPTTSKPLPSILVLARPGPESDDIFADLSQREDLCLLRVATPAAANRTVAEMPVALVIACPETAAAAIESVVAHLDQVRRGTPVLAIRPRQAQAPSAWSAQNVAVLRMPLLPGVLSRSVDVVLGMKRNHEGER